MYKLNIVVLSTVVLLGIFCHLPSFTQGSVNCTQPSISWYFNTMAEFSLKLIADHMKCSLGKHCQHTMSSLNAAAISIRDHALDPSTSMHILHNAQLTTLGRMAEKRTACGNLPFDQVCGGAPKCVPRKSTQKDMKKNMMKKMHKHMQMHMQMHGKKRKQNVNQEHNHNH